MQPTFPELWNRAWLYQRWMVDGLRAREIAAEVGCTVRSVTTAVERFGMQRANPGPRAAPQPVLESKRQLKALYAEIRSMSGVARHLHCQEDTVRAAMDRHGIPRRRHIKYTDKKWFADALRRGLTVSAMAAELNCDRRSVYQALKRFDLPRPAPYRGGAGRATGAVPRQRPKRR